MYESFFSSDTTTYLEYMSWFRVIGKPYLLSVEATSMQLCQKRPRRSSQQHRSGGNAATGSSSAPIQQAPPISTPHSGQFTLLIPIHFTNPEARTVSHSNTKEGNRGKDKCDSGDEDEYEGRCEDKEDDDDDYNEEEELVSRG
ncbi:hypothetical protein Goklo_004243 [Gossypium klotzschianum]|uniref:Uncharacterized protein n=1 Tax=Gossypium klotzschianum TaxID=34286 RepID=A0A7J8VN72_9ROSI|nr:hypothetical protein [Gossypium klotzschianum]